MLPTDFKTWAQVAAIIVFCVTAVLFACALASIGADPEVHNYV